MPGIDPQQDPYGFAPATDTMSPPDDQPEAMPMPNAGPADLTVDDAQPAPPFADEQRRRDVAARSMAALDAAVAQMDRDRAPPARNARAALDHIDVPDRYAHHIETGKSAVRLEASLAGQPDAQAEAAANDYQSTIHLAHVDARATDDAIGALVAIRRHGADMRPEDKHKALAGIAPRFTDERAIADVEAGDLAAAPFAPQAPKMAPDDLRDRMLAISPDEQQAVLPTLLQRYKGDAARSWAAAALGPDKLDALIARHGDGWYPALPEDVRVDVAQHIAFLGARGSKRALPADPAGAATRIVNRPGVDDERRQKALDELNWRMMQADRTRQTASTNAAAEADALVNELGDSFTSIAQIPPAVRRDLSKDAVNNLLGRAARNMNDQPRVGSLDLPLATPANGDASPHMTSGGPVNHLRLDSIGEEAANDEGNTGFEPPNLGAVGENIATTTFADSDTAVAKPSSIAGEYPDGNADPYRGLRNLVKRLPEPGTLQNANASSDLMDNPPEVALIRHELANRWLKLNQQQRLTDPELARPAKMLEAMRAPLQSLDPRLRRKIGLAAAPAGKYVADQIAWMLEHKVLPRRIAESGFPTANEVRLGERGAWSNDALAALHEAADRALNARQKKAWDYFTRDKFLTPEQAAGLIAALTRENNLDPDKWQNFTKNAPGYGIAQWNEHRRKMFEKFTGHSLIGSTFDEQLAFVRYELEQGEYREFGAQLRAQTDAYQAGYLTTKIYEAPAYKTREQESAKRGVYAQDVLQEFSRH